MRILLSMYYCSAYFNHSYIIYIILIVSLSRNMPKELLGFFIAICFSLNVYSRKYTVICSSSNFCGDKQMVQYTSDSGTRGYSCVSNSEPLGCPILHTEFNVIKNCGVDQKGNECANKLCVTEFPLEHCVNQLNGAECPVELEGKSDSVECKDCETNSKCTKCIFASGQETCFSQNQCSFNKFFATYGSCTNGIDTYGQTCKCCAKTVNNIQHNICSELLPLFNTQTFRTIFSRDDGGIHIDGGDGGNTDANNTNKVPKWQKSMITLYLLCLMLFLMFL